MPSSDTIKLNNGVRMPMIGLGTFASKPGEVQSAVKSAIEAGYRHIDGAYLYHNEEEVGEGVKLAMQSTGVKREELFITSKLWSSKNHPDEVEQALRRTLADLQTDYVDLYLVHWPHAYKRGEADFPQRADGSYEFDEDMSPTTVYLAMEKMVEKGLAKSIGISNFNSKQVQDVLDHCKIKPVTNQVECHPYFNQEKLRRFCADRGIVLTAYSPLGAPHGIFQRPEKAKNLLQDPKLDNIGKSHGKSIPQIILRWMTQRGIVVVPKSVTPARIAANIDVFDFRLSDAEMDAVDAFDLGPEGRFLRGHSPDQDYNCTHKHYPFNIEF